MRPIRFTCFMEVLPKDIIRTWILPYLTQSCIGRPSRVDRVELLEEAAGIAVDGLFLTANSAFDTTALRQNCAARDIQANIARNRRATERQTDDNTFFDPELYRRRAVIEHTNYWLDSFKTLLVRYKTSSGNWLSFH